MRSALSMPLLLLTLSTASWADPLFSFTVSGDGHTFAFTAPNPPTVVDHPQIVDVTIGSVAGTVDGMGGYTFYATIGTSGPFTVPDVQLSVIPLPPGIQQGQQAPYYDLYGPLITTLIADAPNPNPLCCTPPNDLLTFSFVPGDYSFYGIDPAGTQGSYVLDITALPGSAATPEPATWSMVLTGLCQATGLAFRRRLARADRGTEGDPHLTRATKGRENEVEHP